MVYMWFGANMAGRRNKNAFKCVLQVLILSQTQPLGIKNVVWGGLEVVWGGLEVVWGVLGWFGVFPRTRQFTTGSVLLPQDIPGYPRTHKYTQRYLYSIIFIMFLNQIRYIFIECVIKSNITIKNIEYVLFTYE